MTLKSKCWQKVGRELERTGTPNRLGCCGGCRMWERSASLKWLSYGVGTVRLWYRTETESSTKQCPSNVSKCPHRWHLDNKHIGTSGEGEFVLVELLEKVLKEIKYETELKGEVKWSWVGLRKERRSRTVVEGQGAARAVSAWSSQEPEGITLSPSGQLRQKVFQSCKCHIALRQDGWRTR